MSQYAPNARRTVWWLLAFFLVVLGMGCSAYLLVRHLAVPSGGAGVFDICRAIFGSDCSAAIRSPLAVQLGIPLAGWGLVHFAVVGTALVLTASLGETFRGAGTLVALALCAVATVLGALLTVVMVSGVAPFCPLCVVVHTINLLLIPVISAACARSARSLWQSLGFGLRYLAGAETVDPVAARWNVVGLVTLGLVAIVGYQWVLIQSDRHSAQDNAPMTFEQVLAAFESGPIHEVPLDVGDPRVGPRDAKPQLVLFSDFQCPACQRFAQVVAHAREHHPEMVVVFKHYPLGTACNPGAGFDLHPLSCTAAYAAEAANKQGKFWEYHDALFASKRELDADVLRQIAEEVGLDMSRFDVDLADPATQAKIAADVALGNKLKLVGTPTALLNGRILSTRAMAVLDELIEHESSN